MRSEVLGLGVICKHVPRSPSLASLTGDPWDPCVCFPLKWKCAHDSRLEARNSQLQEEAQVESRRAEFIWFLRPLPSSTLCLKFCFSSGVLFPRSHSFWCLGISSHFQKKINEATEQAYPTLKNTQEVRVGVNMS